MKNELNEKKKLGYNDVRCNICKQNVLLILNQCRLLLKKVNSRKIN